MNTFKRYFKLIFCFLLLSSGIKAQISLKSLTTAYTQNFNKLASSGTSTSLPSGWRIIETGTAANTSYEANTGSSATGNTYSFGLTSNSDRALGALGSGSVNSTLGASFKNASGKILRSITITYTGELWRKGDLNREDKLDFQFSTNATSLTNGTWTDINQLDFISPNSTTIGSKDGNAAINRKSGITSTIQGLSIAANAVFWIRWRDIDATGSDDGLGIDDFRISISATDLTPPVVLSFNPVNTSTENPIQGTLQINFSEPIVRGSGFIYLKRFSDGATVKTIASSDASIVINSNIVSIPYNGTAYNTDYYVEMTNGCFKDASNNNFSGISGSSTWKFKTQSSEKLKIVNWNIEWFGHSLGPVDDVLQEQNVKIILQNINADLYALGEIVNVSRLQNIVSQMPGYEYIVADFCSASSTATGCTSDQKLAFVYRSSVIKKIRSYGVLRSPNSSPDANYNWSSGRYPFLLEANVLSNGIQKLVQFIAVHAKANTSDYVVSYNRRKNGAIELKDSLLAQYHSSNWIVLGDYNDDLDKTITTQVSPITESSFASFTNEPSFKAVTLPLSLAGQPSTVSYPDIIDHVTVSNEMHQYYVPNSARTLKSEVESWVTNFGSTTSDHYPIYTEFILSNSTITSNVNRLTAGIESTEQKLDIKAVVQGNTLNAYIQSSTGSRVAIQILDMNGKILTNTTINSMKGTQHLRWDVSNWSSGIYLIKAQNKNQTKIQKVFISKN